MVPATDACAFLGIRPRLDIAAVYGQTRCRRHVNAGHGGILAIRNELARTALLSPDGEAGVRSYIDAGAREGRIVAQDDVDISTCDCELPAGIVSPLHHIPTGLELLLVNVLKTIVTLEVGL